MSYQPKSERDPSRWPTPEEFVRDWEEYSDEERLERADLIIVALSHYMNCLHAQYIRGMEICLITNTDMVE